MHIVYEAYNNRSYSSCVFVLFTVLKWEQPAHYLKQYKNARKRFRVCLSPRVVYFFCCNFISNTQQFMKRKFFFFIGFNVNKMDVNSKWIWSPPLETNFHEQCSVVARISRISIGFNDEQTVAQFPVTWQPKLVVPSDLTAQTGRTADQCSRRWRCEWIKMLLESAVFQFAIRKNDIENLDLV